MRSAAVRSIRRAPPSPRYGLLETENGLSIVNHLHKCVCALRAGKMAEKVCGEARRTCMTDNCEAPRGVAPPRVPEPRMPRRNLATRRYTSGCRAHFQYGAPLSAEKIPV